MRKKRLGSNIDGSNTEGSNTVTRKEVSVTLTTEGVTLWPPSKFLSPEDDMKMQERVIETIGLMSSSRLAAFRELNNVFTPNKVKN